MVNQTTGIGEEAKLPAVFLLGQLSFSEFLAKYQGEVLLLYCTYKTRRNTGVEQEQPLTTGGRVSGKRIRELRQFRVIVPIGGEHSE